MQSGKNRMSLRPAMKTLEESASVDHVQLMTESVKKISEQTRGDPAAVEADEVCTAE